MAETDQSRSAHHEASGEEDVRRPWAKIGCVFVAIAFVVANILAIGTVAILRLRQNNALFACQNNLRQLGMAVTSYQVDHSNFPPGTVANDKLPPDQRPSWLVSLLPYYVDMEAQSRKVAPQSTSFFGVYARINLAQAWDAPGNREATAQLLRVFLCPNHPAFDEEPSPAPTYYVGIAGIGPNAAELPVTNPHCGFFGYDRRITPGDVPRGLSYTMIVSETSWQNGPWAQGGFSTIRGLDPNETPYTGRGRPFGGLHPGVVNVLFADGAVLQPPFADPAPPEQFAKWATLTAEPDEPMW